MPFDFQEQEEITEPVRWLSVNLFVQVPPKCDLRASDYLKYRKVVKVTPQEDPDKEVVKPLKKLP